MKKIISLFILIICSILLISCDKNEKEIIEPTIENNYLEKPTDGKTPKDLTVLENIKIAEGVIINNPYFKTVTSGVAVTKISLITNEQKVYAKKLVCGNEILYYSATTSKYKTEAIKRHYLEDKVLIQKGKIKTFDDINWNGKVTEHSYDYIKENIGYIQNILTGYIINEESIIEANVVEDSNHFYSVDLVLNHEVACQLVKKEIKFNSGALEFPVYESLKITIHMNKDWQVEQIILHDIYQLKVRVGITIDAPVDSIITENFYYLTKEELKEEINKGAIIC